jgi:hypothetical protein
VQSVEALLCAEICFSAMTELSMRRMEVSLYTVTANAEAVLSPELPPVRARPTFPSTPRLFPNS